MDISSPHLDRYAAMAAAAAAAAAASSQDDRKANPDHNGNNDAKNPAASPTPMNPFANLAAAGTPFPFHPSMLASLPGFNPLNLTSHLGAAMNRSADQPTSLQSPPSSRSSSKGQDEKEDQEKKDEEMPEKATEKPSSPRPDSPKSTSPATSPKSQGKSNVFCDL